MFRILISVACAIVCLMAIPCHAQTVPDSHEIIQQLALASMVVVGNTTMTSVSMPSNWEKHLIPGESLTFRVPFHPGVMGNIQLVQDSKNIDDLMQAQGKRLNTSFQVSSREDVQADLLSGTKIISTGRLAGEAWMFIFFSGTLSSGTSVTFYAQIPQNWFYVYIDFMNDILMSLGPKEVPLSEK